MPAADDPSRLANGAHDIAPPEPDVSNEPEHPFEGGDAVPPDLLPTDPSEPSMAVGSEQSEQTDDTPLATGGSQPDEGDDDAAETIAEPGWMTRIAAALALTAWLAVLAISFALPVRGVPFYTKGEPREALVVQTIRGDGPWLTPLRNGDEIPSKPPLFHWLGALASTAHGTVDETAVRSPSYGAALLTVATTAILGWAIIGPWVGVGAAVIVATTQQFTASAVTARVDMTLAALVSLALSCVAVSFARRRRTRVAPLPRTVWVASAAGILAKGPVALILVGATTTLYALASRRPALLKQPQLAWAAACLAVPVAWYIAAYMAWGEPFLDKLIVNENVLRVIDPDAVGAGHVRPFWYYVPLLLGGFAPWSLFLPLVAADCWRRRRELDRAGLLFPIVWFVTTFLLFSVAGSKRAVYLLPAYPALAILVAAWWQGLGQESGFAQGALRWTIRVVAGVISVVASAVALQAVSIPVLGPLGSILSPTDADNLGVLLELVAQEKLQVFTWTAALVALSIGLAMSAGRPAWRASFVLIAAVVTAASTLVSSTFLPALAARQTQKGFVREIRTVVDTDASLSFYRDFDYGAVFYWGRPIPLIDSVRDLEDPPTWLVTRRTTLPALREELLEGPFAHLRENETLAGTAGLNSTYGELVLVRLLSENADERSRGKNSSPDPSDGGPGT